MGRERTKSTLASDYMCRGGSYIEALKLLLDDLQRAECGREAHLLCDTMIELNAMRE